MAIRAQESTLITRKMDSGSALPDRVIDTLCDALLGFERSFRDPFGNVFLMALSVLGLQYSGVSIPLPGRKRSAKIRQTGKKILKHVSIVRSFPGWVSVEHERCVPQSQSRKR